MTGADHEGKPASMIHAVPRVMGVVNVTPDSFSDGGKFLDRPEDGAVHAARMLEACAALVDIGGESISNRINKRLIDHRRCIGIGIHHACDRIDVEIAVTCRSLLNHVNDFKGEILTRIMEYIAFDPNFIYLYLFNL